MAEAKAFKMIPHCTKDTITYEMEELVMCKDCKWFLSDNICGNKRLSDQEDIATLGPDWFCADGRKRE